MEIKTTEASTVHETRVNLYKIEVAIDGGQPVFLEVRKKWVDDEDGYNEYDWWWESEEDEGRYNALSEDAQEEVDEFISELPFNPEED